MRWRADAEALYQAGRIPEAITVYQARLSQAPEDPDAWLALGRIALDLRRADAPEFLLEALRLQPKASTCALLGQAFRVRGEPRRAAAAFGEAVRLEPEHGLYRRLQGQALAAARDLGPARDALFEASMCAQPDRDALCALWLLLGEVADPSRPQEESHRAKSERATVDRASLVREIEALGRHRLRLREGRAGGPIGILGFERNAALQSSCLALAEALAAIDHSVILYSEAPLPGLTAHKIIVRSTQGLNDADLLEQIRADELGVLLDLAGHHGPRTLRAVAARAAHTQVQLWAHAESSGLASLDAVLTAPSAEIVANMTDAQRDQTLCDLAAQISRFAQDDAPSQTRALQTRLTKVPHRSAGHRSALDLETEVHEVIACLREAPSWGAAQRVLGGLFLEWARTQTGASMPSPATPRPLPAKLPSLSVIICSVDPAKWERIQAHYARVLAEWPHELIPIHDARSLCEGYNRGAARSRGEWLIFSHDDIEILDTDFARRFASHMDETDVLGFAGTTRLESASWSSSGVPHAMGHVLHRDTRMAHPLLTIMGSPRTHADGTQALDGMFIATHRHVWERLRFDEETFRAFHFYDLDFTYRAHLAGLRQRVMLDSLIAHDSLGRYDAAWHRESRVFRAKFPELNRLPTPSYSALQIPLESLSDAPRLRAAAMNFGFGLPVTGA